MLVCIPGSQSTGLQWQAFVGMEKDFKSFVRGGEFFDQPSNCQLLKTDSVSWS
jgi:hypothetical protein